mmetsp:Transcript_23161/g.35251  ORF Transcript_23161/g.35251 Transcript_23161/m.35251 type:complete len:227 (+) Transcript_23161:67-747(+)
MFRSLPLPPEIAPHNMTSNFIDYDEAIADFGEPLTNIPRSRVPQSRFETKIDEETFSCPYCPDANLSKSHLFYHLMHAHRSATNRVACPVCVNSPETFPCQNLLRHLRFNHRIYSTIPHITRPSSPFVVTSELSRAWRKAAKSPENMWDYISKVDILVERESVVYCESCRRSTCGEKICVLSCDHIVHEQCPRSARTFFPVPIGTNEPRCPGCSPPKKRTKRNHRR